MTTRKQISARSELLLDVPNGSRLQLYVPTPGPSVFIAGSREALELDTGQIEIMDGAPVEITWSGELWARAIGGPATLHLNLT